MSGTVLQHVTFSSFIDVRFWSELGSLKLDGLRLSSEPRPFWGSFATPKAASQPNTDSAAQKTATLNFGGASSAICPHARWARACADVIDGSTRRVIE